jgi:ERCC4-type nuclease
MVEHYDVSYLLVEGIIRSNISTGLVEEYAGHDWREIKLGSQRFTWVDWEKYLTSLEWAVRILRTDSMRMTVATLAAKYRWYQKAWKEHKSLQGLYYAPYPVIPMDLSGKEDYLRLVAAALPHIGPERSLAVIKQFHTVDEMCAASVKEWQQIDGIGAVISKDLWQFLHDREWGKTK